MKRSIYKKGFALPTILIASIVMLTVLAVAISAFSAVRSSINDQYYNRLAKEAAESGIAMAEYCLGNNSYVSQWDGKVLRPNTSCSGGNACTSSDSCFVARNDNYRTTFTVAEPVKSSAVQIVTAVGKVELIRESNSSVWRTFEHTLKARVGADISFDDVTYGYATDDEGGFFFTVTPDGKLMATGSNGFGQLGIGNSSPSLRPTRVPIPGNKPVKAVFTSFLSKGTNSFVVTRDGEVYGSGRNNYGQLGRGNLTSSNSMVKFNLPASQHAVSVAVNGDATYVLTAEGNIYAAGRCGYGMQGTDYTISGCSSATTPKRVSLPTANPSNPNTIPVEIVTDKYGAIVRMSGGAVYGWGENADGYLGQGNFTSYSKPVKIGTYGNSGQPAATQLSFDGDTLYIVGSDGVLQSAGRNEYGQLGHANGPIENQLDGLCMSNRSASMNNGNPIVAYTCNGVEAQSWTITNAGLVRNATSGKCLDDGSSNDVNGNLVVQHTCSSSNVNQVWEHDSYGRLKNVDSGKCLDISGSKGSNSQLMIWSCANVYQQRWIPRSKPNLEPVNMPSGSGSVVGVYTDQWFTTILTSTGRVYGMGSNVGGALGNGTARERQMELVRFNLPSGVTAKKVYTTSNGPSRNVSNTLVVGSNDRVYGAGSNDHGQLGVGSVGTNRNSPVVMGVINGTSIKAKDVISGYGTTVVLTTEGVIYTVGNNNNGQLGDGTTTNSSTPKANKYTNVLPLNIY